VVNGAGAAANSCTQLYIALGAKPENIVMLDSKGVINTSRTDLNDRKKPFATTRNISTLEEAVKDADMFLGLSVADVLTPEMLRSMSSDPIVFAWPTPIRRSPMNWPWHRERILSSLRSFRLSQPDQ
jgi:malate dehydrogenase (oxaloacetate-decarboxylating)(NADP+)